MKNVKVLLIEDDEILSKVIFEELKDAGFGAIRAFDGEAGLKMAKSSKPDLILLDLILPKKHGLDVLKELKSSPVTANIPVIILSMLGQDEDIKKGLKLGANDYIVKSQHPLAEIIEKIKDFFAKEQHPEAKKSPKSKSSKSKRTKVKIVNK